MNLSRTSPRLIAIDMDGTLLGSDHRVSPRNLAALRLAQHSGVEAVIATGRRHCYAMHVLRDLNLNPSNALISSNGAVIRTIAAELLHRSHMPLATARWLCQHAADFRHSMVLTFDNVDATGEDSRGALVCERLDHLQDSVGRWIDSNEPYIAQVARLEDALHTDAPIQMMLCGSIDQMTRAEAVLTQHPRVTPVGAEPTPDSEIVLHRTIYPERDLSIVDILPAGCSKASALRHLAQLRGIDMRDTMAIGDNWNDVPMLEAAGHPVLMSNAPDDLKLRAYQRGWTIAPSNDEDGVAQTIESVLAQTVAID